MTTSAPAIDLDALPEELRLRPQWVVWRYEERQGQAKPTKVPYAVRTGKRASTTDPETWATFAEAVAVADRYAGIGYVFSTEDPYFGFDLDGCRNPETSAIAPWAIEILGMTQSYTEESPSGTGLHVFLLGRLPPGTRRRGQVEVYEMGRYFTMTGRRLEELPAEVREPAIPIAQLHATLFPPVHPTTAPLDQPPVAVGLDDGEIIRRARTASNGDKFTRLWRGDHTGFSSHSEADLALCALLAFWTGRDSVRMDRLFRQSELMRAKWDDRRGDTTYGAQTIATAIDRCREVYGPRAEVATPPVPAVMPWVLYDGADAWDFPSPEFIIPGLLQRRGVIWWGGLPKRFKSLLLLYTCLSVACRRPHVFESEQFPIQATPKILFVSREDGGPRLKARRDDIVSAWNRPVPPGAIQFLIRPVVDLMNAEHVQALRDLCRHEGVELLVLDTWTALSPTADPMGAKDQAQLAAVVVQLAQDIDGAVVVVDHSRKNRPDGQALSSADIFGPLQKWAAAEHIVMLESTAGGGRLEVFLEGKDAETGRFFLSVAPQGSGKEKFTWSGTVEEIAAAQRKVGQDNRGAVLEAVRSAAEPVAVSKIKVLNGTGKPLGPDTISGHLTSLVEANLVERLGKGKATRYRIAETNGHMPSSAIAESGHE